MSCTLCEYIETKGHVIKNGFKRFDCPICGEFIIHEEILRDIENIFRKIKSQKHLISGYTRELKVANRELPILTFEIIILVTEQAPRNPFNKINKILINLANMSLYPGMEIIISERLDYTLGYCCNPGEFGSFIRYLKNTELLDNGVKDKYRLTAKGWSIVRNYHKITPTSNHYVLR